MEIPISLITPSPKPIRSTWAEDKMQELAQSIREQGVIVPIKVRPANEKTATYIATLDKYGDGWAQDDRGNAHFAIFQDSIQEDEEGNIWFADEQYEVVYGHRRVEAARRAGLETIPAIVEGLDDDEALIQALIENVQREDMSDVDKGRALVEVNKTMSRSDIASVTGLHIKQVENLISLVNDEVVARVFEQGATEGGKDLSKPIRDAGNKAMWIRSAAPDDDDLRRALAEKTVKEQLSEPVLDKVAKAVKAAPTPELKRKLIDTPYNPVIHNADVVREVAKYPERPRNQATGFEWESRPEVAAILEALKQLERRCADIEDSLPEWKRTVDIGKFSPEAVPFFITRLRRANGKLHTTARRLQELGEWIEREQGKLALPE